MTNREYMNTSERIEQIIKYLMQSKNYRAAGYKIYFIVIASMCLVFVMYNHMVLHILLTIAAILIYLLMTIIKKKREDAKERHLIECNFNREEFVIIPAGTRFLTMGVYRMIAYYVEGDNTYKFRCKVEDDQDDLYSVMIKIREKGEFPKLKVLVNPTDFKDYRALGHQFIEDTLRLNKELVGAELDKYYGGKWKY